MPFAVYGGVVADDDAAAAALEAEAEAIARQLDVAHLEYRNMSVRHADWPAQDLYVTFRKGIFADEEANMQAIPSKQRALVRKSVKNGLRAESMPMSNASLPCLPTTCFATARRPCPSAISKPYSVNLAQIAKS